MGAALHLWSRRRDQTITASHLVVALSAGGCLFSPHFFQFFPPLFDTFSQGGPFKSAGSERVILSVALSLDLHLIRDSRAKDPFAVDRQAAPPPA